MSASEEFVERVIGVVETIPAGRVMTYGDVAAAFGSRAARGVGWVMAHYGSHLPWWRVVRADGRPPRCHEASAIEHYRAEDTPLTPPSPNAAQRRIDLARARWRGVEASGRGD